MVIHLRIERRTNTVGPKGSLTGKISIKPDRSTPGRIRTCDTSFRKAVLYPLSYGGGWICHVVAIRARRWK